jgi:hypothetical protein
MDNPEKLTTLGTQDTGQTVVSLDCPFLISPLVFSKVYSLLSVLCLVYPMLLKPKEKSRMDNPEKLTTLGTQDTGQTVVNKP